MCGTVGKSCFAVSHLNVFNLQLYIQVTSVWLGDWGMQFAQFCTHIISNLQRRFSCKCYQCLLSAADNEGLHGQVGVFRNLCFWGADEHLLWRMWEVLFLSRLIIEDSLKNTLQKEIQSERKEGSWWCFKFRIAKVTLHLFLKSNLFFYFSFCLNTLPCLSKFVFPLYLHLQITPSSFLPLQSFLSILKTLLFRNILCLLSTSPNMLASLDVTFQSIAHNNTLLKAIIILKE